MKKFYYIVLVCLEITAFSPAAEVPFTNKIDVLHYDIHMTVFPETKSISGHATVRIKELEKIHDSFCLYLENFQIDTVKMNGAAVKPFYDGKRLFINSDANRDTNLVQVYYHGKPVNDGHGGFWFSQEYVFTIGQGLYTDPPSTLRYWVPSHDVPADKATADFFITVPGNMQVIANGVLQGMTDKEDKITYHWRERKPMAPYLFAIACGEFSSWKENYVSITGDTIPLEYYVYPEDETMAREDWKNLSKMMLFFESFISPYPFDRYSMVELPMRGAMEHQTMTSYAAALITGDHRYDYIVAHELAHHWFGNMVTCGDWRDIWLNEGFATYCEALYFESIEGAGKRQQYMDNYADMVFQEESRLGPFPIYNPDYLWGATVYQKGAWILHMLRWTMGEKNFKTVLSTWIRRFAFGHAVTSDFQDLCEEVWGRDLDWFFQQWVYKAGHPELDVGWDYVQQSDNDFIVTLNIRQKNVFVLPLEIEIISKDGPQRDTVRVCEKNQQFFINVMEKPQDLVVDPDSWVLKDIDYIAKPLPAGFSKGEFELSQNYPNPFMADLQRDVKFTIQVGKQYSPQRMSLTVYNLLGQKVRTLMDRILAPGIYTFYWDGCDDHKKPVPAGVYFYQLSARNRLMTKKMSIVRND